MAIQSSLKTKPMLAIVRSEAGLANYQKASKNACSKCSNFQTTNIFESNLLTLKKKFTNIYK
jgi:hypothetical protein